MSYHEFNINQTTWVCKSEPNSRVQHHYLSQGGYVLTPARLFGGFLDRLASDVVEGCCVDQRRTPNILVGIQISGRMEESFFIWFNIARGILVDFIGAVPKTIWLYCEFKCGFIEGPLGLGGNLHSTQCPSSLIALCLLSILKWKLESPWSVFCV